MLTDDIVNQRPEEESYSEEIKSVITSQQPQSIPTATTDINSKTLIHTIKEFINVKSVFQCKNEKEISGRFKFTSGVCSICLLDFKVNEMIAYSENNECSHFYHRECIIPWFMKGNTSCPNCRRNFITFKKKRKCCFHG